MKTIRRFGYGVAALLVPLVFGSAAARAESLDFSVVAETFDPAGAPAAAAPGKAVTYTAVDAGYIDSGDPVAGMHPAPGGLVDAALRQALSKRGYQPASPGATPDLLIVCSWGEIRHDSIQIQPNDRLKGNDRARLLLVSRTSDAERIERDIVTDRYFPTKVGAMVRTADDREALQLSHDELSFVVVSAFDGPALQQHNRILRWQVRLSTRAVGHTMSDSLVSLVTYGAEYFGRNESRRRDLREKVVPATTVAEPARSTSNGGSRFDPTTVQEIVRAEHAKWSGT